MCHVWVAAVHMLTEVREEVDFVRDGSISAEHHTGLQILPASNTKVHREDFQQSGVWGIQKNEWEETSEEHYFHQQTPISKGSVSLASKGRVRGLK